MENKFTETFNEFCEESYLTQQQLATKITINQSQISKYKSGIIPNINNVVKICDYFECSVDYIVGLTNTKKYKDLLKGYNKTAFYNGYEKLLKQNNTNHFQLSKKGIVCETSLRLWKQGMLPDFEVLCEIAYELGGSVDKLLGRIK